MDAHTLLARNAEMSVGGIDLSPLSGKDVLVTGSTGLIGVNLMAALVLAECGNVDGAQRQHPCGTLKAYDYIIHAAGYAQPSKFMAEPMETVGLNTTLLMTLLGKLKHGGRLVFLSSSEVYSGSPKILHSEDDIGTTKPSHQRGVYIEAKRCGEAVCHAARAAGTWAAIARVSLAYGPGVKAGDTRVMSEFISQAMRNDEIVLKDGGSDRRTYCYVSDTVQMILNILLRGKQSVYNVGGHGEISIVGLARKIGDAMKVPVRVPRNVTQSESGAPPHVTVDMSRYCREFGTPTLVSLDAGLPWTIAWHRALVGHRSKVAA